MRTLLKVFAWLCKIAAVLFWLGVAWTFIGLDISDLRATSQPMYRDAPEDWGTPAFKHRTYLQIAELVTLATLAILPNRWLVFSRVAFAISLLIALSPCCWVFYDMISSATEWSDLISNLFLAVFIMIYFIPLPFSIILSFLRHRKGEKIFYA
jgi:hypothetical protein